MKRIIKYSILFLLLFLPLVGRAQEPNDRWRHLRPQEKETILRNYQR